MEKNSVLNNEITSTAHAVGEKYSLKHLFCSLPFQRTSLIQFTLISHSTKTRLVH